MNRYERNLIRDRKAYNERRSNEKTKLVVGWGAGKKVYRCILVRVDGTYTYEGHSNDSFDPVRGPQTPPHE